MKKLNLILILFGAYSFVFAQNMSRKLGDKEYSKLHYADAAEWYEKSLVTDSTNTETLKRLGDCYAKIRESSKAERVYTKLINLGYQDTDVTLAYAQTLARNGKYEDAQRWYAKYSDMVPTDESGKNISEALNNVGKMYSDSSRYKIYFLNLNTEQSDFSPVPYDSGIVFTSARIQGTGVRRVYGWNNTSYLDLYYLDTTKLEKEKYFTPIIIDDVDTTTFSAFKQKNPLIPDETRRTSNDTKTLGFNGHYYKKHNLKSDSTFLSAKKFSTTINSKYHDGPCAFDGDSVIYFTRNNYNKWKAKKSKDGVNKLKMYYSKKKNETWSKPKEMPFNNNEYSVGHPALSKDGRTLYFASDMPGTNGATDIYKVMKVDTGWTKPENLGSEINTIENEMFPYVDENDNLYFASNGHAGLGGLDIFKAKLSGGKPKNLGYPINSKKDDFGLIASSDMKTGYFSSNRKRGGPDDDIYMFDYLPGIKVEGIVVFVKDESPIDKAMVSLNDKEGSIAPEKENQFDGKFTFEGLEPDRVYYIPVKREGFAPQMAEINTFGVKAGETITVKIYLDKAVQYALEGTLTIRDLDPTKYEPVHLRDLNTGLVKTTQVDEDGRFYFPLDSETDYEVFAAQGNMKSNIEARTTKGLTESKVLTAFLYMQPQNDCDAMKRKYFVENIYYDLDKSLVRSDAKLVLDKLIDLMNKEQDLTLEFASHTDSRASGTYNQRLAMRRSKSVMAYLTSIGGINISRLTLLIAKDPVQGCLNSNYCDEAKQQSGRRTSFSIYKNGKNMAKVRCTDGTIALQGKAFSSETTQPMGGVKVVLLDKITNDKLSEVFTADNGLYSFDVKPNKEYTVVATKDSCADNLQFVTTKNIKVKVINLDSPLLCEGDKIRLEKIFFDLGKYNIRADAAKELDKVIRTMNKYPKLRIKLGSHTDSRGSTESNRTLSSNRAKSSAEYIIKKGKFDPARIEFEGYGESRPVNGCVDGTKCNEKEYQLNRRTEMEILSVH